MAIPIFTSDNARNTISVYGGLSGTTKLIDMNVLVPVPDSGGYIYEVNEIGIKQGFKSTVETKDAEDGLEMYGVNKTHKLISLQGVCRAFGPDIPGGDRENSDYNNLHQAMNRLSWAFDPALRTFQSQYGLRAEVQLRWQDWDDDDGNFHEKMIWARPQGTPDIVTSEYFGMSFPFTVNLLAGDPRTYENTLRSPTWNSPFSPRVIGSSGDYPTIIEEIRFAFSGAGSGSFLLTSTNPDYDNPDSFYSIDFSGIGGGAHGISLFPRDRRLVVDGFIRNDLFKSPPVWGVLPPAIAANTTFTLSGTTNLTLVTFFYRDAFSL